MIDVLVIGAGPTGLLMAAEAARFGMSCRIIDKLAAFSDKSRALAIQPRTLELFDYLGIVESFLAKGLKTHGVNPCCGKEKLAHLSFEGLESKYPFVLSLEQSETEQILADYLESFGIKIEREVEFIGLKQEKDRVIALLRGLKTGKEEMVEAAWAIGCDGAHSQVRKEIDSRFLGTSFPSVFSLADVKLKWSRPYDELFLFLDPKGILGVIPMPGKQRVRLVFQLERCQIAAGAEPTLAEVQQKVRETVGGDAKISDPLWMANFHINSRLVSGYRKGRVFLAGDAAHIHSPAGGQGMNSGLQDVFNLGWKLAQGDEALLDTYNLERRSWGRNLIRVTYLVTRMATLRNRGAVWLRNWAIRTIAPKMEKTIIRAISQISIQVPKSCIAIESGSFSEGPKAGTRAPNAPVSDENDSDLYSIFRKTQGWHLLLFGDLNYENQDLSIHRIGSEKAKAIYGVKEQGVYLIRPDQIIAFRGFDLASLQKSGMESFFIPKMRK